MDAIEAIMTRRSVRKYQPKPVPEELVQKLLAAAMQAPSARNGQPWHFIVLDDRRLLDRIPEFHPYAEMVRQAPLGVLVCGDVRLEGSPNYWPVDCSAAAENLLLAAHALGLGAVWTGVYPRRERMDGFRQLLQLPDPVMPHAFIPIGWPAQQPPPENRFRPDRIHRNGW